MKLELVITAAVILFLSNIASAAEITVLAAGPAKEVFAEVVPQFEKGSGHRVVTTWSGSANIRKRIADGEVYDLVILGAPEIDGFIQQGKVTPGSRTDLMKSGVGMAVRAGATKPNIGSSEEVKKTLLAAKSIGYSTGPSGDHIVRLIEQMGIAEQVKPKLRQVPSGTRIGTIIVSGDAEMGFQQISELIHEPGLDYVGPLPSDIQKTTVYAAGILTGAKQPEAAKALVKSLTAPDAATVIKQHGMEPG